MFHAEGRHEAPRGDAHPKCPDCQARTNAHRMDLVENLTEMGMRLRLTDDLSTEQLEQLLSWARSREMSA